MPRHPKIQEFHEITRDTPSAIAGRVVDGRILAASMKFNASADGNRAQPTQIDKRTS